MPSTSTLCAQCSTHLLLRRCFFSSKSAMKPVPPWLPPFMPLRLQPFVRPAPLAVILEGSHFTSLQSAQPSNRSHGHSPHRHVYIPTPSHTPPPVSSAAHPHTACAYHHNRSNTPAHHHSAPHLALNSLCVSHTDNVHMLPPVFTALNILRPTASVLSITPWLRCFHKRPLRSPPCAQPPLVSLVRVPTHLHTARPRSGPVGTQIHHV